jgi:type I restriction enzyme M protein
VDESSRLEIVDTLTQYRNNDYARVFDKEFFYFNKQAIMLTNVDEHGNSFEMKLKEGKKSEKLTPTKLTNGERELTGFVITVFDSAQYESLADAFAQDIKPFIASLDYKEHPLVITTATAQYWHDAGQETLIKEVNGKKECLGCGKIVVKSAFKKANKKQPECIEISVELTPDYQKDYEIIPFHKDEVANLAAIEDFMAKYITRPFRYLDNVVGVELNFNKIFYKPEKLREVVDILAEIDVLDGG